MANSNDQARVAAITAGLRTSFVPSVVHQLADIDGFLDAVWAQLAPSVDTAGFLGSALYMADMALGAVEEVYDEPTLSRESLLAGGLSAADLDRVIAVLDVFHWLQPQLLLLLAALAEAHDAPSVGGQGRPEPREPSEREQVHIDTPVDLASPQAGLLPEVPVELQLDAPPDLYRAIAVWPAYFDAVWDELQHLVAYPLFRQRGRALYFYARSSSRFLAVPLQADDAALGEAGMRPDDIARARVVVDRELSAVSTMMMHCTAMRVGLGLREREVVREA